MNRPPVSPAVVALALGGCSFVLGGEWDRVRDVDGDGAIGERFGGPDCRDDDPSVTDCDADADGVRALAVGGEDCDDGDADVGSFTRRYADRDGDGHGDPARAAELCGAAAGWSADADDCDDGDAEVHPGADERCDALDRDCDGDPIAGAVDPERWPRDADRDGFGGPGAPSAPACEPPPGFAAAREPDCDDRDPEVNPAAPELPWNGVDDDCDGVALEDLDGDGADGEEGGGPDCDDDHPAIHPGADERCNLRDDDCDGWIDEEAVDAADWWPDLDGDGFGDLAAPSEPWCVGSEPAGLARSPGDCDDRAGTVFPGASEVCDGADDDCDGRVDEGAADAFVALRDLDGDGAGGSEVQVCALGPGLVAADAPPDCDDTRADRHPGAVEVCGDGVRQDCADADLGDCDADGVVACGSPGAVGCDCLDDPAVDRRAPEVFPAWTDPAGGAHPEADERCNGLDDDCDGFADGDDPDDVVPADEWPSWHLDADGDGAPGPITVGAPACSPPAEGTGPVGPGDVTDCDDTRAAAFPGAPEQCNGLDDDCDAEVDESAPADAPEWYRDADGDGFGAGAAVAACGSPGPGFVGVGGDCDDARADVSPGAREQCDGRDDDCDGVVDAADPDLDRRLFPDADGDGFGATARGLPSCAAPGPGTTLAGGDCDDAAADVSPGAPERCDDGRDDDCDGFADEDDPDLVDGLAAWPDRDHDGAGAAGSAPVVVCVADGWALDAADCDDADPGVGPAAPERCGGGDEDCDGLVDDADPGVVGAPLGFLDGDGDGFPGTLGVACAAALGEAEDCDDGQAAVSPGAVEVCDGVDQDCDGVVDDDPQDGEGLVPDADGDGFGDEDATSTVACPGPGWTSLSRATDCDDGHALVFPGAPELCDGGDTDCDDDAHDAPGEGRRYVDADRDGSGSDTLAWQCAGSGADAPGDCDDDDPAIGAGGYPSWVDGDGDGVGVAGPATCDPPQDAFGDCDDGDPSVFPGAGDGNCDGVDQDCDGVADQDAPTGFVDGDGDGYGVGSRTCLGSAPVGGDCADGDASVNPGQAEVCGNGVDDDCSVASGDACAPTTGLRPCWPSTDTDGYGDLDSQPTLFDSDCVPPFWSAHPLDCPDEVGDPAVVQVAADQLDDEWPHHSETCLVWVLGGDQALAAPLVVPATFHWRVLGNDHLVSAPAGAFVAPGGTTLVLDGVRIASEGTATAVQAVSDGSLGVVSGAVTHAGGAPAGIGIAQPTNAGPLTVDGVVVTGFATGVSASQSAALRRTEVWSNTTGISLTGPLNQLPLRALERVLAVDNVTGVAGHQFTASHLTAAGNGTGLHIASAAFVPLNVALTDTILAENGLDLDNDEVASGRVSLDTCLIQDDYDFEGLTRTVFPKPDPRFVAVSAADAATWDLHLYQLPCSDGDDAATDGDDLGYYSNLDPWYETLDSDGIPDGWEVLFFGGGCQVGVDVGCDAYAQCQEP